MENSPGSMPLDAQTLVGGRLGDQLLGRRVELGVVVLAVGADERVRQLVK